MVIVMKKLVSISENDVLPSSCFTAFFTSLRAATSIFKFIYSTLIYLYLFLYLCTQAIHWWYYLPFQFSAIVFILTFLLFIIVAPFSDRNLALVFHSVFTSHYSVLGQELSSFLTATNAFTGILVFVYCFYFSLKVNCQNTEFKVYLN